MKRIIVGVIALSVITLTNFWFYIAFKPEEVIINRIFATFLGSAGTDFDPSNWLEYAFYHAFGDGLAVLMMMLALAILFRVIRMEPSIWFFRLTLLMFLVMETLQLVLPGNFKWVDMAAYVLFYFIGLFMAEYVLERNLRVPINRILTKTSNRD